MIHQATTALLDIAYETSGPADGPPVLLLHGWPDDIRTFDHVAPALQAAGYRTIAPYLRGFGPTRFLSDATMRSGQIAAMAQDAIELMDLLHIGRFAIVGHDWGARIAYLLASLLPERVSQIAALSVAWRPGGLRTPDLEQAQHYWYQWFLATARGAEALQKDGVGFARHQWQTWGPEAWFAPADFEVTAASFANPDWAAITLHSYRVRWGGADPDPRYADLEERAHAVPAITVPTLVIQGGADRCTLPRTSEGKEAFFVGRYHRHLLPGIGHFPTREAPGTVAELLLDFLED